MLVSISHSLLYLLSIFKVAAVCHLGFSYFRNFCQKFNLMLILRRHAKFGEHRTIRGRVIAYFRFLKMAAVRHLGFGMTS